MKIIHEFVIKENPCEGGSGVEDEIISILRDVYMNPMERELVISKLKREKEKKEKIELMYRSDLVIDWLIFHKDNKRIPLLVECMGMDNIDVENVLKGFKNLFSTYDFINYKGNTVGPHAIGCLGVSREILKEMGITIKEYQLKFFSRMAYQTRTTFILEIFGVERHDSGEDIVWCMLYDRQHNKQGYVAFSI